ncbi:MAG: hypothetical protein JW741_14325 [Sedimentisphaerales bacterium]|nr:hypothetical protein [Sedimentisphaerales bacterium]
MSGKSLTNRIFWLTLTVGVCLWLPGMADAVIAIDTDALTISIDGNPIADGRFQGTDFTAAYRPGDGATPFTFWGDLDLAGETMVFSGARGSYMSWHVVPGEDISLVLCEVP